MSVLSDCCRWAACALLAMAAYAQESRGTVVGRVIDGHDAPIRGVQVAITNIDTGVATTLKSNESGSYAAPLLLPGNYRVTAEHSGFKKLARDGIAVGVNDYQ